MKIKQLSVFIVLSSLSVLGYANSGGLYVQAAPQQSYQTAINPSAAKKKPASVKNAEKSQMEKVQAIMEKSKKAEAAKKVSKKQVLPSVKKVGLGSEAAHALQAQMTNLNQAALMYQQVTNQKIETLSAKTEALQRKVTKLTQALLLINQELARISLSNKTEDKPGIFVEENNAASGKWSQRFKASFQGKIKYLSFAALVVLLLMIGLLLKRSPSNKKSDKKHDTKTDSSGDSL